MISAEVTLRRFQHGDLRPLAEAWTEAAPADAMTPTRLRDLVLLDRNFDADGLFVAERDGAIVGASYAVRRVIAHALDDLESDTGWIPFFFVVPGERSRGTGRALVVAALDWLRGEGRSTVVFSSYTPNYVLPGLDIERYPEAHALLGSLGFSTIENPSAMDRSLIGYRMPDEVAERVSQLRAEGWYLGHPDSDDLVALISLAGTQFNSDWARAIREGVVAGALPLERIIVAKDPHGQMIGWAQHGTYEQVIERFGPFGVLPSSRGTGLGKAILHLTLQNMVALGAHSAWFLWADEGSVASALYAKTGFSATRSFHILSAEL